MSLSKEHGNNVLKFISPPSLFQKRFSPTTSVTERRQAFKHWQICGSSSGISVSVFLFFVEAPSNSKSVTLIKTFTLNWLCLDENSQIIASN